MTDRERIHILSKWLYSDGQNWTDHEKAIDALFTENERLREALHEVFEQWAGSEGFIPETAPEGYLLELTKKMALTARKALEKEQ